ncbi:hypothetical protein AALO_G00211290 [Alosa alosa]|uniref:TNFR-Cys domain-containing protein n=1 Tax=Alosa alosa TaxID=278164 RepID=A0AAV6G341_9TELE|nr:tumor necrosis factor receptor superfamily member 14-like [Alosa alosa]KAG5268321.1 hypothetical protein AALO_G00211290 [Alosa alosa]
MWRLCPVFIISVVFLTAVCVFCSPCGQHEYLTDQHTCCPMCNPGFHVVSHCSELNHTTCEPCPESSFTDELSGLLQCRPCAVCDPGLRVRRPCNSTSDTLCKPLESTDTPKQEEKLSVGVLVALILLGIFCLVLVYCCLVFVCGHDSALAYCVTLCELISNI